eukprot:scaffold82308_cov32-Tisochrysis_lutea.AAC.2
MLLPGEVENINIIVEKQKQKQKRVTGDRATELENIKIKIKIKHQGSRIKDRGGRDELDHSIARSPPLHLQLQGEAASQPQGPG